MNLAEEKTLPNDSPEARSYNRIRRWLSLADMAVGIAFLIVLLVTGWTGTLRDLSLRMGFEVYSFALFLYLAMRSL